MPRPNIAGWNSTGKGTRRRPEDRDAIERNWPFPAKQRVMEPEASAQPPQD